MRHVSTIIIHHTASAETTTPAQVEQWHADRGISRPGGYHHMLWLDEALHRWTYSPVRAHDRRGAHDRGQNAHSIGIVVAGDYTTHRLDPMAWTMLVQLVAALCHTYGLPATAVEGHREHEPASTPTACPGWDVEHLRQAVAMLLDRRPLPAELIRTPLTDAEIGS